MIITRPIQRNNFNAYSSMPRAHNTPLSKSLTFNFIIIRSYPGSFPSGVMAANTLLYGSIKKQAAWILTQNNIYFRNVRYKDDINHQMLSLIKNTLFKEPKIAQHIYAITFPEFGIPLYILQKHFPKINIFHNNSNALISWDVLLPAVAAQVITNTPFTKNVHCTVIAEDSKKKLILNSQEYLDTKQPQPDYSFVLTENGKPLWTRFRDFKTGKYDMNVGSNVYTSNKDEYEEAVRYLLLAQKTCYKKSCPIVSKYIDGLLADKSMTFSEKNDLYQEFLQANLQKYPHINPSLVFFYNLPYNIANQKPSDKLSPIIQSDDCFATIPKSEETIAKSILLGGKKCIEAYNKHPGNNKTIINKIEEFQEIFENAKDLL